MFEIKIDRNEILESPLLYSVLLRRDGSKVYEIHKNRITDDRGIVDTIVFEYILYKMQERK